MAVFIHDTANVSEHAQIGDGTKIWNQAQVREDAEIGKDCIISKNVYIEAGVKIGNRVKIQNNVNVYHGVTIGNDVFLGPSMTFTNDLYPRAFHNDWNVYKTQVQDGASLGAHVTVVCGCTIGKYAMAGAGSVIAKNIPDYALVVGNPARQIGWVCRCGMRLTEKMTCIECGRNYKEKNGTVEEV